MGYSSHRSYTLVRAADRSRHDIESLTPSPGKTVPSHSVLLSRNRSINDMINSPARGPLMPPRVWPGDKDPACLATVPLIPEASRWSSWWYSHDGPHRAAVTATMRSMIA